jgi:hypothetical protein
MKIISNQGGPDLATQSALVAFAHARGKTTMTHATLLEFTTPLSSPRPTSFSIHQEMNFFHQT